MYLLVAAVASATGFPTFTLFAALWGYGSSWLAEIIKQDHWPKAVNAVVANAMLVVSAALATLTVTTFTWNHLASALLAAATAALINHQFVLKGTGIGDWLQRVTSIGSTPPPLDTNGQLATALEALIEYLRTPAPPEPQAAPVPAPAHPEPVVELPSDPAVVDVPAEVAAPVDAG